MTLVVEDHTKSTVIWLETNLYCDTDQSNIKYLLFRSWYLAVSDFTSYCHNKNFNFYRKNVYIVTGNLKLIEHIYWDDMDFQLPMK